MRGIKWHVCQKRSLAMTLNEVASRVGKQVRAVAVDVNRLRPVIEIFLPIVDVGVIVDVARPAAKELVESPIGGAAALGKADIPLSKATGRVARRLQKLRQDCLRMRQPHACPVLITAELMSESVAQRVASREKRAA